MLRGTPPVTITERNQRLFELRHKLLMKRAEVKMIEQEIRNVNDRYDRQSLNLFEEMFGTDVTYTETAYN